MREAPEKVLWFMIRLLPWIPYHEPTYGLNRQAQLRLEMTPEEVEFKKRLLQSYTSQLGVVPETQFGYPDLIENPQPMKTPPMIASGCATITISGCTKELNWLASTI